MSPPLFLISARTADEPALVELSDMLHEGVDGDAFEVRILGMAILCRPWHARAVPEVPFRDFGGDFVVRLFVSGPAARVGGLVSSLRDDGFVRARTSGPLEVEHADDLTEAELLLDTGTPRDGAGIRTRGDLRQAVRACVEMSGGTVMGGHLHHPTMEQDVFSVLTRSPESLQRDLEHHLPHLSTTVRPLTRP